MLPKNSWFGSHLYFSESTAAKADRYLSIAACATGVKSSPMWQAKVTSIQCENSCGEGEGLLVQLGLSSIEHKQQIRNLKAAANRERWCYITRRTIQCVNEAECRGCCCPDLFLCAPDILSLCCDVHRCVIPCQCCN